MGGERENSGTMGTRAIIKPVISCSALPLIWTTKIYSHSSCPCQWGRLKMAKNHYILMTSPIFKMIISILIYINSRPICHNGIGWSHNSLKFICILSTLHYLRYSHPWFSHAIFQINLMMPWLSLLQCLKFEYDVMWSNHKKERELGLVTTPLFQKFIIVIYSQQIGEFFSSLKSTNFC